MISLNEKEKIINPDEPRKWFYVLSGGGAIGYYQWLVLKYLAPLFPPVKIGGTSAGSLNALMWSLGLIKETDDLYQAVSKSNAAEITKPGLAKIENGGLQFNIDAIFKVIFNGLNVLDAPKLLFKKGKIKLGQQLIKNFSTITSLMDNSPLYETLNRVIPDDFKFQIQYFLTAVSMETGDLIEKSNLDFDDKQDLIKASVASTTIPIIWQLVKSFNSRQGVVNNLGDGGLRNGSPLSLMFDQLDQDHNYGIIVINCTPRKMSFMEKLLNIFQILARTASIVMNENLNNDLDPVLKKNEEALKYGETIGRKYVPIHIIEYSGDRGAFSFSEEAFKDMANSAYWDASEAINKIQSV